ncbi:hypothetical protein VLK81_05120 [Citroniella saccharovorans]|uniref:Uncharacterized protein n=2 Tax=Citroniella saccharovorans TaxID=2053367 RepID=A0AAW9MTQ7_9FIRM|nr:hypothetical protein [Citroniella saccharovorans]MEB3429400.1 hypothetical protein [Citroniella saccharovorans]
MTDIGANLEITVYDRSGNEVLKMTAKQTEEISEIKLSDGKTLPKRGGKVAVKASIEGKDPNTVVSRIR